MVKMRKSFARLFQKACAVPPAGGEIPPYGVPLCKLFSRASFLQEKSDEQICTCTLSRVVGAIHESPEIKLTDDGKIIDEIIQNIPGRYQVTIDAYVIMPNHIHLIIIITDDEELRAIRESPLRGRSVIAKVIGYIKMNASKKIHRQHGDAAIWQRGFHVILEWVIKMDKEKELPQRKRLRLRDFDYSTPGGYFITICTHNRKCTLSRVVGAIHESPEIKLTDDGKIIDEIIQNIPGRYQVTIDAYVIMPNHIHLIIIITDDEELRAIRESPLRGRSVIAKVIGYIKMNASKKIHRQHGDATIWQRGFHDHIIRDRRDYEKISKYIYENPLRWQSDCFYAEE